MVNKVGIDQILLDFTHCGTTGAGVNTAASAGITCGMNAAANASQGAGNGVIVSLTSFPQRMPELHYCLFSLLIQSLKPERLLLWLGEEEFPGREADLPPRVLQLRQNGLEILWTKDIKSYKKLIPALRQFGDKIIVTADDDLFYTNNWLELLYADYLRQGKATMIYAHRAHRIRLDEAGRIYRYALWESAQNNWPGASYLNFATSGGGTLYPPGVLPPETLDEMLFMRLAPQADDIFFWAMAVLGGRKTRVVQDRLAGTYDLNPAHSNVQNGEFCLSHLNVGQGKNDEQMAAVLEYFPEILTRLRLAAKEERDADNTCDQHAAAGGSNFDSAAYWENRYRQCGNSGAGSYHRLAAFKAEVINNFICENKVQSLADFGVGDGNQLAMLAVPDYAGLDVSETVLNGLRKKYAHDPRKKFMNMRELTTPDKQTNLKAELCLSCDVVYHLVEDNVFHSYMESLFDTAQKYVIIYSSNVEAQKLPSTAPHVRHRKFTGWIARHRPDWKCVKYIPNKYPAKADAPEDTSFADFYIYSNGR